MYFFHSRLPPRIVLSSSFFFRFFFQLPPLLFSTITSSSQFCISFFPSELSLLDASKLQHSHLGHFQNSLSISKLHFVFLGLSFSRGGGKENRSRVLMGSGRSFGSGDEFREGWKKKGGLPLAVFLSFNDRDVHPQCPNAPNPYHKCGRYCLDKIPFGDKLLDGERSGGSSGELEKMSERKGVTPGCPNSSNPFHKCADYCFEKIKREDVVKEPGKKKGVLITKDRSGVNTNCKYASNPYHKCDEFCYVGRHESEHSKDVAVMKPKEQKIVQIADRVSPQCKYASNPYHVCSEYCFQEVPESRQPVNGMMLNSPKERKIKFKNTKLTGVSPHCRNSANPFHKCTEYCFQNVAERDKSDGAPIKGKKVYPQKERKADHPVKEKDMKSDNFEASNTSHINIDSSNEPTVHVGTIGSNSVFIKEEKEDMGMMEILDTQPLRIDASDLFKEWAKYCSLNAIEDNGDNDGITGQRERN